MIEVRCLSDETCAPVHHFRHKGNNRHWLKVRHVTGVHADPASLRVS